MLERANESEIYRKLAYTDELTGLYNRTAFKRDIVNQQTVDKTTGATSIAPTVIFMFDLNDLKKCNDTYGHEYGDKYISMASSIINHVFGHEGRCYRIGGDEFCVILPFISNKDLSASLELFRRKVRECNRKRFVVPVTIAVGYAVYDPNIDQTLSDTQNRADALMYQDKIEQKKGRVS
jgi:diguanylate cyclase (GGDEF)-like protein